MRYTATFSNGRVLTRTSERSYSHAYLVVREWPNGKTFESKGFSREQGLAEKERAYYAGIPGNKTLFSEVVAVEVKP